MLCADSFSMMCCACGLSFHLCLPLSMYLCMYTYSLMEDTRVLMNNTMQSNKATQAQIQALAQQSSRQPQVVMMAAAPAPAANNMNMTASMMNSPAGATGMSNPVAPTGPGMMSSDPSTMMGGAHYMNNYGASDVVGSPTASSASMAMPSAGTNHITQSLTFCYLHFQTFLIIICAYIV